MFSSQSCLAYSTGNLEEQGILLVFPGRYGVCNTPAHPAFLRLVASLQQQDFVVRILDMRLEDYRHFKVGAPLFVGITATSRTQIKYASRFAQYVREKNSFVPIVWTGAQLAPLSEQDIPCELADIVVRGEAELAIKEVAEALAQNQPLEKFRRFF